MNKKSIFIFWVVSFFFTCFFTSMVYNFVTHSKSLFYHEDGHSKPKKIEHFLGYELDTLKLIEGKVKRGQFFSSIMTDFNVSYDKIITLAQASKHIFDVRKMMSGSNYYVLCGQESNDPQVFIYEKNPAEFMVFHLDDSLSVKKLNKKITVKERHISGSIENSLYESMQEHGGNAEVAMNLAEIFAWTIDFYRLQKNDAFEIIYEERMVDTTSLGIDGIKAVKFTHEEETFYAFHYKGDFYDENGNSMKKAFLKSPVKFSRISSHYNLKRFHPVQRRIKAHLGTDYAAPAGTPILATGDGQIIEAKYGQFNGNYVKIRHNQTYTTQYLHMSKFAKGIKSGKYVKQGDVIGYVGSTGLASGPHVCFRFWKNNKQVNHLNEKFIASDPIKKSMLNKYLDHIHPYIEKLTHSDLVAQKAS